MKIDPDAPAMPHLTYGYDAQGGILYSTDPNLPGMSIRATMAMHMMSASMSSFEFVRLADKLAKELGIAVENAIANSSVKATDALIAELNKEVPSE